MGIAGVIYNYLITFVIMEYSIDARFENKGLGIRIHFLTTINVTDEMEADLFHDELLSGFRRMKWEQFHTSLLRIDNNESLKNEKYEELNQIEAKSDNILRIEQYLLENPDQNLSLSENLIKKLKEEGESNSKAFWRNFNIPIEIKDTCTGQKITGEFYYLKIEQLIPKS